MKLILLSMLFPFGLCAGVSSAWSYGKAASSAKEGNWKDAQQRMSLLMIDAPDQPDLLYDSGVAAYRLAEFEKAAACFEKVTKDQDVEKDLKKEAQFNLGNTKVAMNNLQDAITHYQAVLAIEPDNEPAKHNLEKVRQMLEQQQQEQEKDKNQQPKKESPDQKKDQNNDQSDNDQSGQDKQKDDQS